MSFYRHTFTFFTTSCINDNIAHGFLICYDEDSKAEVNDWFDFTVPDDEIVRLNTRQSHDLHDHCCGVKIENGRYQMKIRGPFIIIRPEMRLLDTPYSQSGLIDINLARLSMNPNDKIAQKRYAESEERKKLRKNVPEHDELWYGCQPFYNLNKMKAQYLRNRYICPDIIKKPEKKT